jgi:hypothetical protein
MADALQRDRSSRFWPLVQTMPKLLVRSAKAAGPLSFFALVATINCRVLYYFLS